MKLAFYDEYRLGIVDAESIIDVSEILDELGVGSRQSKFNSFIEAFSTYHADLVRLASQRERIPLSSVTLRPPVPWPTNIVCMAVNYMEDGTRAEPAPINAFLKARTAIVGPNDTMILPDVPATVFEGEAELAVVIGKIAKDVRAADAMSHVFGYMNFVDGSARGLPPQNNVFYQAKSRDTFAPIGPYLVTADEVPDPCNIHIRLKVNGETKQDFNTNDMAHKIARCLEWITSVHTLYPGDIVATGTNHRGLNAFQDGDLVEMECEGLGTLRVSVRDDLRRSWSRETRLERSSRGLDPLAPQLSGKYARLDKVEGMQ